MMISVRTTCLISMLIALIAPHVALANEQPSAGKLEAAAAGGSLIAIAGATLGLIAIVALGYAVRQYLMRRKIQSKNDPRQLLHELCQAHGLSGHAERLLRKAAAAVGTPHPGRFFLEPQLFRQAQAREEMKGSRLALGLLRERLYGEDTP